MNGYRLLLMGIISGIVACSVFSANTLTAGGHYGILRSQSADMLGDHAFQIGGGLEYGQEWEYIHTFAPDQVRYGSPDMLSGAGYIGFGALPVLDLGINLPAYYDDPHFGPVDPKGVGDLELSLKLSGFWLKGEKRVITCAYYMAFQFPTGVASEGFFPRHAYYGSEGNWSSGKVLYHPMLISSIHFNRMENPLPFQLNLNFGGVFNTPKNSEILNSSIGLEYFPNKVLTFFTEVSAEERITTVHKNSFFRDLNNDPIFITPGVKITFPHTRLTVTLAGDIGISEADEQFGQSSLSETGTTILHQANMLYNAYFGLNWLIPAVPKDKDGDGIMNKADKCPDQAEDKDGFEDNDGCPDNDNDKDGIEDTNDRCPNYAEDKDGFQDAEGCPDMDNDNDNIPDSKDNCPGKAGIPELDGCPDVDSDDDGMVDRRDKCPNDAEDIDQFQDEDGCPDADNDNDGVLDYADKCPNIAGPIESEGCTKTKEIARGKLILKSVNFESGKAILLPGSFRVLDEVALSLREWPEIRIEIQGHSDTTGNPQMNRDLSQKRAETVRQYLVDKGVAPERLTAVGYGQEVPIADNKTVKGRAQNRRVELHRID